MSFLWTEKYRAKTLGDYVWKNAQHRAQIEEWIKAGECPNVLFGGSPGTGKTSLAKIILNELQIPKVDILEIDASKNRRIDIIQEKIDGFLGTWALGDSGIKYILFDEADSMSNLSQRMLRSGMETYSGDTRFIFTANDVSKIIGPLMSRLQVFKFEALDNDEFIARMGEILSRENIEFEIETLLAIVEKTYPDMRKCINICQQFTVNGILNLPDEDATATNRDYIVEMANLVRADQLLEARKLLVASADPEEYPEIFRFCYQNLDLWGVTEEQKDDALLAIRKGLVYHSQVADPEINLAATFVELCQIRKQ
jgi:DNA polymerase III delta prime subunit